VAAVWNICADGMAAAAVAAALVGQSGEHVAEQQCLCLMENLNPVCRFAYQGLDQAVQ
jgi:hypothetical protein